jgi:hypothetical protein
MIKKLFLSLVAATLILSLSWAIPMAHCNNLSLKKNARPRQSPFLITKRLPHLTRILKLQWDNPILNLSRSQKEQLIVVRKETISGIQNLKPQITVLENQVSEGVFMGKSPEELQETVQTIAKLKAEATMIHLNCIYDTNAILSDQQLKFLLSQHR